jgi:hypothetical protein
MDTLAPNTYSSGAEQELVLPESRPSNLHGRE